jgi:uncharacterized membrane protein
MRGICRVYAGYPAPRRQMAEKIDSARESMATIAGPSIYSYNISIGCVYILHMLSIYTIPVLYKVSYTIKHILSIYTYSSIKRQVDYICV